MRLSAFLATLFCIFYCVTAAAAPVSFVALGDMPYNQQEAEMMSQPNGRLASAIRAVNPPFVLHYGDLKPGDMDCSDKVLSDRQRLLAELYPKRLVYTPGDNDWTDCDRDNLKLRTDERERLDKLRELFFHRRGLAMTEAISGIERQPDYPENILWQWQQVHFATVHVVGSNNGRAQILLSNVDQALDAVERRDQANKRWLAKLFRQAQQFQAKALVITLQADLYKPPSQKQRCNQELRVECDGLIETREFIEFASANVDMPVLLLHGDTSSFCLEQPNPAVAANFWRLNGPGDFKLSDGVTISIDSSNERQPFSVKTLLSHQTPPQTCVYKKK